MHFGVRLRSPRAAISLMFAINGILWGTWIARIPAIADHLNVSKAQLGSVLPAFAIGALIALPCAGWLIGKIGSARTFTFFGLSRIALFPLLALAPTPIALAAVLFVFGFAHGAVDVSANAQGVEIERKTFTSMLSSVHGFFSLGGLIGAALAGVIAQLGVSIQVQFTTLAILSFVLYALGSRRLVSDEAIPAPLVAARQRRRRLRLSLPPRVLWPLGAIAFCTGLADEAVADWGGLFLHDELRTTTATAALAYTVYSLTMLIGRLSGDSVVKRFGAVRVVMGGGMLSAIGLIGGSLIGVPWAALAGFAVIGLGLSVITPINYRAAGSTPGIPRGRALASVATVGYLGFLTGPPLMGGVAEVASLRIALMLVGLLGIALIPLARSTARPEPPHNTANDAVVVPLPGELAPSHRTI